MILIAIPVLVYLALMAVFCAFVGAKTSSPKVGWAMAAGGMLPVLVAFLIMFWPRSHRG
ncbi:hypothetical protein ACIQM4_28555 [Streptomyces sp. NPDC091272]|uniref:hypothetical protein n=1 Tax=Streptomyces sp. NPDC091272 TaxID=3365981 RepID=UPI0038077702